MADSRTRPWWAPLTDSWNDCDTPERAWMIAGLRGHLAARLGDAARLLDDEPTRRLYSRDMADLPPFIEHALFRTMPLLVVQPRHAEDVARVLQWANETQIPVVPRGIGSSAFGGPVPTRNGVVLDLSPMQTLDPVDVGARTITVDAGARWGDVDDALARAGLGLFTYPSNRYATVGGWIASGGYGLNGLRFGHVSHSLAALQVVTPQGEIKTVQETDPDWAKYIGTEGLMGVITRATLRARPRPQHPRPHLLYFESDAMALAFAQKLAGDQVAATSGEFYDATLLQWLNTHHSRHAGAPGVDLFERKPALLLCADDETDASLSKWLRTAGGGWTEAPAHVAGHLWADRLFPMKVRSLGPSLLAAEAVLPLDRAAEFLQDARATAERFGLLPGIEGHLLSTPEGLRVLMMPMFLTDITRSSYAVHLALVSLLDRVAGRYGGRPYNLGVWHASFASERYGAQTLQELREFKRIQDPRNILNPGKFFRVESRLNGLTGLVFQEGLFKPAMDGLALLGHLAAPFTRPPAGGAPHWAPPLPSDVARPQLQLGAPDGFDDKALAQTAVECTSCGACVSVCPAYLHTRDERVTGRAKMWLARKLATDRAGDVTESEAAAAWLCVRCRACTEVCQAQLPLMAAYEKIEARLHARFGRPDALIRDFVSGLEQNADYRAHVGLTLPLELAEQRWKKQASPAAAPANGALAEAPHRPHTVGGKYHVATRLAPPRLPLIGKFAVERGEPCISCGQCAEACVYSVHSRNPRDLRRMNEPQDELCRGCMRCVQECPRGALTLTYEPVLAHIGRGVFDPDVISSLARQADEGKLPVLGAGYRGAFAGPGFDGMWTDMSEIVRPTRDGIHGREYISTLVELGRRPLRIGVGGETVELPRYLELPVPFLFNLLPIHRSPNVHLALARAAQRLGTLALISRADWSEALKPYRQSLALVVSSSADLDELAGGFPLIEVGDPALVAAARRAAPDAIVTLRMEGKTAAPERVVELAREGAEVFHFTFDPLDPSDLLEALPRIHTELVAAGLRDAVTVIASGGIAMAEHAPKTIIVGADAVAIDLPLLVALECALESDCLSGGGCPRGVETVDPVWGEQRLVNLVASWRNQLLEVMGAMGMREVRRLRGERGRALFKVDLDRKLLSEIGGVTNG